MILLALIANDANGQNKKELTILNQNQSQQLDSLRVVVKQLDLKILQKSNDLNYNLRKVKELESQIIELYRIITVKQDSLSSFRSLICKQPINDQNGNQYTLLNRNSVTYLNGPLKVTKFLDGTQIVLSKNKEEFVVNTKLGIPTYCYVNFNEENLDKGLIYNKFCWLSNKHLAPEGFEVLHAEILDTAFSDDYLYEHLFKTNDYFFAHSDDTERMEKLITDLTISEKLLFEEFGFMRTNNLRELNGNILLPVTDFNNNNSNYFCSCSPFHPYDNRAQNGKSDIILGLRVFCFEHEIEPSVKANFPGGQLAFQSYVDDEFDRSKICSGIKKEKVEVLLKFKVFETGKISDVICIEPNGLCSSFVEEAIRIMEKSPRWVPAQKDGVMISSHREVKIVIYVTK